MLCLSELHVPKKLGGLGLSVPFVLGLGLLDGFGFP